MVEWFYFSMNCVALERHNYIIFLWYTKFQVKQNINILNSLLPEISSSKRYRSIDVLSIFLCVRYHIYSLHTHVMFSMILLLVQMNVTGKIY